MMNDSEKMTAESCKSQRNINDEKDGKIRNPPRNNQVESSMEIKNEKKEDRPPPSQKWNFEDQEDKSDDNSSKKCDSDHSLQEENETDDTVYAVDEEGDGGNDSIMNDDNDEDDDNESDSNIGDDNDDIRNGDEGEVKNTIDENGRELSAYEIMRLKRIQRNQKYLARLGLNDNKENDKNTLLSPFTQRMLEAKRRKRHRRQTNPSVTVPTRSSSRRTTRINYSEFPKTQADSKFNGAVYVSDTVQGNDNEKNSNLLTNLDPSKTVTKYKKKSEQLPMFIFREFKRQERENRLKFKAAQRLVRDATVEVKYTERKCNELKKKLKTFHKRKRSMIELQEKKKEQITAQKDRVLCLPLYFELKNRRLEMMTAISNMRLAVENMERDEHARLAKHKMSIIDAMEIFPYLVLQQRIALDSLLIPKSNESVIEEDCRTKGTEKKSIKNKISHAAASKPNKKQKKNRKNIKVSNIVQNPVISNCAEVSTLSKVTDKEQNNSDRIPSFSQNSCPKSIISPLDQYQPQQTHQYHNRQNHHPTYLQQQYNPQEQQQRNHSLSNHRINSPVILSSNALPPMPSFLDSPSIVPQSQSEKIDKQTQEVQKQHSNSPSATKPIISQKRPRKFRARNIGGPVSLEFSKTIQRKWLESDVPVLKPSPMFHFVPQVGDIVLYYPSAHRQFLREHPDKVAVKRKLTLRKPLWERTVEFELEMKKKLLKPGKKRLKRYRTKWWTDEWIASTEDVNGCYPIICRVDHTVPEFPTDESPNETPIIIEKKQSDDIVKKSKTNSSSNSSVYTKSQQKQQGPKQNKKPPICLAVTLRPLTSLLPPRLKPEKSREKNASVFINDEFPPPPIFSVLTFPSDDSQFLLPFVWAYELGLSLTKHDPFKLKFKDGTIFGGTVLSTCHESNSTNCGNNSESNSLDAFGHFLSERGVTYDWIRSKLSQKISKEYENKANSDFMSIPEIDFRAALQILIINYYRRRVKCLGDNNELREPYTEESSYTMEKISSDNVETIILDFLRFVQLTLPRWNGVTVEWNDKSHCQVSSWDLLEDRLQENQIGEKSEYGFNSMTSRFPIDLAHSSNITDGGLIYTLDEKLSLKIEKKLNEFIKSDDCSLFIKPVQEANAPGYGMFVPIGMSFKRILRRLRSQPGKKMNNTHNSNRPNDVKQRKQFSFYRSTGAITSDINEIFYNCLLYNNPESNIVSISRDVTNRAVSMIESIQNEYAKELKSGGQEKVSMKDQKDFHVEAIIASSKSMRFHKFDETSFTLQNDLFKHYLCRDWIESSEPDCSWPIVFSSDKKSLDQKQSHAARSGDYFRDWIPQCGDFIYYDFNMHLKFIAGHFHSLEQNQRIVPHDIIKMTEPKKKIKKPLTKPSNDSSLKTGNGLMIGQIKKKRIVFPASPTAMSPGSFTQLSPVLALDISFLNRRSTNKVYTIYWRPCCLKKDSVEVNSIGNENMTISVRSNCENEISLTKESNCLDSVSQKKSLCLCCKLPLNQSFIFPAWKVPDSIVHAGTKPTNSGPTYLPTGIRKSDLITVIKCLDIMKQMSQDGLVPDGHDRCVNQLKKTGSTSAKLNSDIFSDSNRRVTSSAIGNNQTESLQNVSKFHYNPPWESIVHTSPMEDKRSTRNRGTLITKAISKDTLSEYEMMLPSPKLSLDLVYKRLRNGYYRQTIAAVADIQESYVSIISYLLRKSTPKRGSVIDPWKTIANYCHVQSKKIMVGVQNIMNLNIRDLDSKLQTIEIHEFIKEQDSIFDFNKLNPKEISLVKEIQNVRILYATAIVCLLHPKKAAITFGVQDTKDDTDLISFRKKIPQWEADAQELSTILTYLDHDKRNLRTPLTRFQNFPTIKVKIKLDVAMSDRKIDAIRPTSEQISAMNDKTDSSVIDLTGCKETESDVKNEGNSKKIGDGQTHQLYQRIGTRYS